MIKPPVPILNHMEKFIKNSSESQAFSPAIRVFYYQFDRNSCA